MDGLIGLSGSCYGLTALMPPGFGSLPLITRFSGIVGRSRGPEFCG